MKNTKNEKRKEEKITSDSFDLAEGRFKIKQYIGMISFRSLDFVILFLKKKKNCDSMQCISQAREEVDQKTIDKRRSE